MAYVVLPIAWNPYTHMVVPFLFYILGTYSYLLLGTFSSIHLAIKYKLSNLATYGKSLTSLFQGHFKVKLAARILEAYLIVPGLSSMRRSPLSIRKLLSNPAYTERTYK